MISTHTIQLQEQIQVKELPKLTAVLPFELTSALLKGRQHYLCLRKFENKLFHSEDKNYDHDLAKLQMLVWLTETLTGDVEELNLPSGGNSFDAVIARADWSIPTVCSFRNADKTYPVKHPIFLSDIARKKLNEGKGFFAYNGIRLKDYPFCREKKDYLLFLGRPKPHKGIQHAVKVAEKTGHRLIIAGPETDYVKKYILPDSSKYIRYIGNVGGETRLKLLQEAKCLLFPTNCFEAFGRVMIESMACGTPVLALNRGSVQEILNGFPQLICNTAEEMQRKLNDSIFPSPEELRQYVKVNYTDKKMAKRYLKIYQKVLEKERKVKL